MSQPTNHNKNVKEWGEDFLKHLKLLASIGEWVEPFFLWTGGELKSVYSHYDIIVVVLVLDGISSHEIESIVSMTSSLSLSSSSSCVNRFVFRPEKKLDRFYKNYIKWTWKNELAFAYLLVYRYIPFWVQLCLQNITSLLFILSQVLKLQWFALCVSATD